MATFLYTKGREYSYEVLVETINRSAVYYPLLKTHDLFDYFANLIKAIVTGSPLVLLDSDLSACELPDVDESKINVPVASEPCRFSDVNEIIDALKISKSEITIFTSGTTGQPKKIVHSIPSLTRTVRTGEKYAGQVWAYAYNPTHMAGLQVFFQAFENQDTIVDVFNMQRKEIYGCIAKYNITHISATPTFYRLLLPYEQDYPSVRRVTLGGEKSDCCLYENIRKIFPNAKINNVYASTEAGSLFVAKGESFRIPEKYLDLINIEDGELLIHASLLGKSDNFRLENGFYHSGDMIEWVNQEEGTFRFKNRKNELINIGGYKVNPGEVEDAINSVSGVRHSLVYGRPNSVTGNILAAEVVLEEGSGLSDLDLRKILKDRLQDFKIPRMIKIADKISLTRSGKLNRSK